MIITAPTACRRYYMRHLFSRSHYISSRSRAAMSEERKRQLRTQMRFMGNSEISKKGRRSQNQVRKNNHPSSGYEVSYEGNSQYSFQELEKKKICEEIIASGKHEISTTENGKSSIFYESEFLDADEGWDLFSQLQKDVEWENRNVVIRGVERPQPRQVAWFGPLPYSYSGLYLEPKEIPKVIVKIKTKVEEYLEGKGISVNLNSVLANHYRNGKDSIAWHSDDEMSMGIQPTIASISLGEIRRFEIRRKSGKLHDESPADFFIRLKHGSLLIMDGVMQNEWQHRVPKDASELPRINLTYRTVYPLDS